MGRRRKVPLPKGWAALRLEVLRRDGWRCYRCGGPAAEVDHVVPAYLGGGDEPENLAAICRACHARKTGREAQAARPARRRPPEPHPASSTGGG